MTKSLIFVVFVTFVLTTFLLADAKKPKMEDVAGKLSCYCGTCPHLVVTQCGCSTADQIKADVQSMIDKEMSEDQIIQSYVARFGDTVLAAPPGSGFNLTAYILPFLAFLLGGFVLFAFLKRQQEPLPPEHKHRNNKQQPSKEEDAYRELLNQELEKRK